MRLTRQGACYHLSVKVKPPTRLRSWGAFAIAALIAVASTTACRKCGETPSDDPVQTMKPPAPPLAAPSDLLAELVAGTPNASWGKLQRGIGGAVGILPASAGGILCAVAGLDPFVASEIDGAAPAYGVVAGDPANPGFVLALKLLDLRKARGLLVDGDTSRYSAREAGGVTELLPKGRESAASVALGLSPDGYFLIARRSEDLVQLAPYATRTLPKRPLPSDGAVVLEMPRSALGTLVKPRLEEMWAATKSFLLAADERMRRDHGGRAPDFGDATAIVGAADAWVSRSIAVVGDLEKMRVALDVIDAGISVATTMTPVVGGGPAATWTDAMKTGDVVPLASLPASSAAALMVRDNEESRGDQAAAIEKIVTSALGKRLSAADAKKLHDVLEDATKARGEVLTSALLWDEPQGASLRLPVRDADAASRAVRGAVDLASVGPFKDLLRVRAVKSSTEDVAGLGKATIATIATIPREPARGARPRPPAKDELGLAWMVEGGSLALATSLTPVATLSATLLPVRKLADEPAVARSLDALGTTASAVLVLQPLRFEATRANLPAAPLVVALGRKDKNATLRIDIANGLLRELGRRQMGL
jgi:hypothetical protein